MQGRGLDGDASDYADSEIRGLQPRVFEFLFAKLSQESEKYENSQYLVKCQYFEIYNEQIMDL